MASEARNIGFQDDELAQRTIYKRDRELQEFADIHEQAMAGTTTTSGEKEKLPGAPEPKQTTGESARNVNDALIGGATTAAKALGFEDNAAEFAGETLGYQLPESPGEVALFGAAGMLRPIFKRGRDVVKKLQESGSEYWRPAEQIAKEVKVAAGPDQELKGQQYVAASDLTVRETEPGTDLAAHTPMDPERVKHYEEVFKANPRNVPPIIVESSTNAETGKSTLEVVDGRHRLQAAKNVFGEDTVIPVLPLSQKPKREAAHAAAQGAVTRQDPLNIGGVVVDVNALKASTDPLHDVVAAIGEQIDVYEPTTFKALRKYAETMGMNADDFTNLVHTGRGALSGDQVVKLVFVAKNSQDEMVNMAKAYFQAKKVGDAPNADTMLSNFEKSEAVYHGSMNAIERGGSEAGLTMRLLQAKETKGVRAFDQTQKAEVAAHETFVDAGTETRMRIAIDTDRKVYAQAVANAHKLDPSFIMEGLPELIYASTLSDPRIHAVNVVSGSIIIPLFVHLPSVKLAEWRGAVPDGAAAASLAGYLEGAHRMLSQVRKEWWDAVGEIQPGTMVGETIKPRTAKEGIIGMLYKLDAMEYQKRSMLESAEGRPKYFTSDNMPNATKWFGAGFVDATGVAIRLPGKTAEAGDRLSYAVNLDMGIRQYAYVKAMEIGQAEGKSRDEIIAAYQKMVQNPSKEVLAQADKLATHNIFRDEIEGYLGKGVSALGHPLMRPFVTFVRTPVNIARFSFETLPGLNQLMPSVRETLAAGGVDAEVLKSKMAFSSTALALSFAMAAQDNLTGYGPRDPEKRQRWLRDHQPFSIRIPDGSWYSYSFAEPFATWLGIAADSSYLLGTEMAGDTRDDSALAEFAAAMVLTMGTNFSNKFFARDFTELFGAIDPKQTSESMKTALENYAKSRSRLMVPSVLAAIRQKEDPVMRDTKTIAETLFARVPGLASLVPPQVDALTGNIKSEPGWLGPDYLSPVSVRPGMRKDDIIAQELYRHDVGIPKIPKYINGYEVSSQDNYLMTRIRAMGSNWKPDASRGIPAPSFPPVEERLKLEIDAYNQLGPGVRSQGMELVDGPTGYKHERLQQVWQDQTRQAINYYSTFIDPKYSAQEKQRQDMKRQYNMETPKPQAFSIQPR